MSRKKTTEIPHYELLFIVPNKFTDEEAAAISEKIKGLITGNGGTITFNQDWGKKKLAYPIKHNFHGYYFLMEFDLAADKLAAIDRTIRLMADILRHQVVVKMLKTEAQIVRDKEIAAKIAAREAKEEKEKEVEEEKKKTEEKTKDAKKVDLKDLDAKLNELLDADSLL
jgi:small subunit ribosomal protein S6